MSINTLAEEGLTVITNEVNEQALSRIGIPEARKWVGPLNNAAKKYGCNSYDRWCAAMAQMLHESSSFTRLRESMNYTPDGLLATFPTRITQDQAARLGRLPNRTADQVAIGNLVYGGRGGNAQNEGFKYRGRGLIQLTFKDNYKMFEVHSGIKGVVDNPDIVSSNLDAAAEAGFWFFDYNKLWPHATNIHAISSFVNTGRLNSSERIIKGYDDRRNKFLIVKRAFLQ